MAGSRIPPVQVIYVDWGEQEDLRNPGRYTDKYLLAENVDPLIEAVEAWDKDPTFHNRMILGDAILDYRKKTEGGG